MLDRVCLPTFLINDACLANMKSGASHAMFLTHKIRTSMLPVLISPLCRTASCAHTWPCLFPALSWSVCRPAGVSSRLQPSHLLLLSMYSGKIHGLQSVHTEQFQPETHSSCLRSTALKENISASCSSVNVCLYLQPGEELNSLCSPQYEIPISV